MHFVLLRKTSKEEEVVVCIEEPGRPKALLVFDTGDVAKRFVTCEALSNELKPYWYTLSEIIGALSDIQEDGVSHLARVRTKGVTWDFEYSDIASMISTLRTFLPRDGQNRT